MNLKISRALEAAIIKGLKSGNRKERSAAIIKLCTPPWKGLARKAVASVGGQEADVEDIFQESLAAMVKNVMQDKFNEHSKLSTYFFSICKRRGMKAYLKKEFVEIDQGNINSRGLSFESVIVDKEKRSELKLLVDQLLNEIGNICANILKLKKLGYSYEEIAIELDYDNPDTTKNQAARCRKKFRDLVEANPALQNKLNALR